MNVWNRKQMLSLLVGAAFLTGGFGAYAGSVANAGARMDPPAITSQRPQPPKINQEQMAKEIAESYGVNQQEVLSSQKQGMHPRDLEQAALLSKASGKSFAKVAAMKTKGTSWQVVEKSLGLTPEKVKTARDEVTAQQMQTKLGLDKTETQNFLKQGYHPMDIAAAALLAKDSEQTTAAVLEKKKINNTWQEVGTALGVSETTIHQDMEKIHQALHGFGGPMGEKQSGPQGGPPPTDQNAAPQE